ncbi:hypothetical protein OUZ56_004924 [Daphnia magna]|uniref:Uncharacterized protein n=1 Tax=Daphnia magna TaxID=35525 RepID=A0ABQ9YR93_9CRUS|nr:hypothetical protein OUZ56_004924 [Daphnia magna]
MMEQRGEGGGGGKITPSVVEWHPIVLNCRRRAPAAGTQSRRMVEVSNRSKYSAVQIESDDLWPVLNHSVSLSGDPACRMHFHINYDFEKKKKCNREKQNKRMLQCHGVENVRNTLPIDEIWKRVER